MARQYTKVEELSENENLKKYLDEGIKSEKTIENLFQRHSMKI